VKSCSGVGTGGVLSAGTASQELFMVHGCPLRDCKGGEIVSVSHGHVASLDRLQGRV
jgi:hypothetical protein